jgi:hypothetical protein
MAENENMWKEENIDADTELPATAELRSVGITANGMGADLSAISGATSAPLPGEEDGAEAQPSATPPPA